MRFHENSKEQNLHQLASNALSQYEFEFEVVDVRLVGVYSNTIFRVNTADGLSYVLRICNSSWRTDEDMLSEVAWLQALNRDTDIGVPQPKPDRHGKFIVTACAAGNAEAHRCVIMSWLPGVQLGTQLTETNVHKLGALFARLHVHAASFSPPEVFTQRKMKVLFALGEQDVLMGDAYREAFTPRTREIFERTRAQVDAAFERLYADPTKLHIIHNDLHHNNVKVHQEQLHPFDFDFTMWGYPVQDLAVALHGLLEAKQDAFETWQGILRAGYETILEWPESYAGQIDAFVASRILWAANYVAQFDRTHLSEYLNGLESQLAGFLETGLLRVK